MNGCFVPILSLRDRGTTDTGRTGSQRRTASRRSDPVTSVLDPASAVGQRERRESATDMRLDGDEMAADAYDGDAGHATRTYI